MGDSPKHKMERLTTAAEAAELFTNLAEGLKQGVVRFYDSEVAFEGQVKIKAELRAKTSKTGLKLSLKFPGAEKEAPTEDAEPAPAEPTEASQEPPESKGGEKSFKKLKKKMKGEFKEIRSILERNENPPLDLIEAFQADCQIMTSFPENGDEYFDRFNAEAYELLGTAQSGDLEALKGVVSNLAAMKNECHKRHR